MTVRVLIDGAEVASETAALSVFDKTLLRGAGCFEAIRAYGGRAFAADAHLERLERSACSLGLAVPPRARLLSWVARVAEAGGDVVVRVLLTAGSSDVAWAPPRTVVLWEPLPDVPDALRLWPVAAPWHPAGAEWELAGVKSLSYAPNMAAQRRAQAHGADDALLVGRGGEALEAPTASVAWVKGGVLETPALKLGILDSITRRVVLEEALRLELPVVEGTFPLSRVEEADEVMILATTKEVRPVVAVGERSFAPGAVTARLEEAYRERVRRETGAMRG